jgi:hypothetical protein
LSLILNKTGKKGVWKIDIAYATWMKLCNINPKKERKKIYFEILRN